MRAARKYAAVASPEEGPLRNTNEALAGVYVCVCVCGCVCVACLKPMAFDVVCGGGCLPERGGHGEADMVSSQAPRLLLASRVLDVPRDTHNALGHVRQLTELSMWWAERLGLPRGE